MIWAGGSEGRSSVEGRHLQAVECVMQEADFFPQAATQVLQRGLVVEHLDALGERLITHFIRSLDLSRVRPETIVKHCSWYFYR